MRIIHWITKATKTHLEYVILLAFPMQKYMDKRASFLRYIYIAALIFFSVCPSVSNNTVLSPSAGGSTSVKTLYTLCDNCAIVTPPNTELHHDHCGPG